MVWIGAVALLVSCSRENPLFDRPDGGASGADGMSGPSGGPMSGPMSGTRGGGMTSADATSVEPPTGGGPGGESLDGPPPPTTGSATDGMTSGDTMGSGECCEPQPGGGCTSDLGVRDCVCAERPECCNGQWDDSCVQQVELLGCGDCGLNAESCCEPGMVTCGVDLVRDCACQLEPSCCDAWSPLCVLRGIVDCGLEICTLPENGCCMEGRFGDVGCDDFGIAHCVCVQQGMPGCCLAEWNGDCAAAAMGKCGPC